MGIKRLGIDIEEKLGLVTTVPRMTPAPWQRLRVKSGGCAGAAPAGGTLVMCSECGEGSVVPASTLMNTSLSEIFTT